MRNVGSIITMLSMDEGDGEGEDIKDCKGVVGAG